MRGDGRPLRRGLGVPAPRGSARSCRRGHRSDAHHGDPGPRRSPAAASSELGTVSKDSVLLGLGTIILLKLSLLALLFTFTSLGDQRLPRALLAVSAEKRVPPAAPPSDASPRSRWAQGLVARCRYLT